MPICYQCTGCGQMLSVGTRMAGARLPCPACGANSVVPPPERADRPRPPDPGDVPHAQPAPRSAAPTPPAAPIPRAAAATLAAASPAPGPRFAAGPDAGGVMLGRKPLDMEGMDLTPMVDMTFLLLIFFMITASFSVQKSIEFPAPSPEQKGAAQAVLSLEDFKSTSIIVRIDERNAIFVDDEPLSPYDRLSDVLRSRMSPERTELALTADAEALHDTVISVVDAANEVGIQRIRLAAQTD